MFQSLFCMAIVAIHICFRPLLGDTTVSSYYEMCPTKTFDIYIVKYAKKRMQYSLKHKINCA